MRRNSILSCNGPGAVSNAPPSTQTDNFNVLMDDCRMSCTVPEAGRIIGVSRNSAYLAAKRGELPTVRIGRRLLVPLPALMEMLSAKKEVE